MELRLAQTVTSVPQADNKQAIAININSRFIPIKYIHKHKVALSFMLNLATMTDKPYLGLIDRYGHYLDLPPHTQTVSLLEGNTPLIKADALIPPTRRRL